MRIGIIGDAHEPYTHPMYRRFCLDTFSKFRVNHHLFIGDVTDNSALSFHEHDPNLHSANDEADKAWAGVAKWRRAIPVADVCIGNHDELIFRKARAAGIADRFVRDYANVWETPDWNWQFEFEYDGALFVHGTGNSGKDAAINLAIQRRKSTAIGHLHSWAGCKFHANNDSLIWGLNVGSGVDPKALAFAYGKFFAVRPVLSCAVVLDGWPCLVPMPCGRGEKYNRRRAGKRKRRVLV